MVTAVGCTQKTWVYSTSSQYKPISGCLSVDSSGLSAIIVSMNCKKSMINTIFLCSQKRTVSLFETESECQKSRKGMAELSGEHRLDSDPYEQ